MGSIRAGGRGGGGLGEGVGNFIFGEGKGGRGFAQATSAGYDAFAGEKMVL